MEFFDAFGINTKIIIAQFVNFVVLMFILQKIGYKPLKKFVEDRTKKIEQGVENAKKAEIALKEAQAEQERLLVEARKDASELIEKARVQAKEQGDALVDKAKADVAAVVTQGKASIEQERQKMLDEVKADVIEMVISSTQKVLSKAIDKDVDEAWLKEQVAKAKK